MLTGFVKSIPGNLRNKYVLLPKNNKGFSQLQLFRDGKLKHGYIVKPYSRSISEFESAIRNSFKGTSTFFNAILLAKYGINSSVVIHNFSLIITENLSSHKFSIKDKEELINQINQRFFIPKEIVRESLSEISNYEDAWN